MGTARGGLNQANLRKPSLFNVVNHGNFELPLHELVVFSFEESQDNRLIWVDTNHGLYLIDRATGKIRDQWHEAAQEGLTGETVMSLFQLKNGQLLLSTRPGGTQILDPETRKVRRVPNPEMGAQEEISFFRTIREHSPDSLLLSGNLGVWLFTPSDENWQLLVGGYCWDALGGAEEGEVLVAENGLHQLDICVDSTILYRWHPTQHDHKRPMTYLFRDSVNLWIGTYGMGLIRVNLKDWSFRRWSRKDGLPSDYVFTILEDEQSRLWVSTTEGLARLDRESGDILTFSMEDGLMDNEFGTSSAFVAEDGEMFFGGNNGFVSFYPDQIEIRQSRFAPPVLITSLSLSGKPMVLDSAVWVKRHITFKGYPQQHLEIGYAGLDFSRPGNLSYQFRLTSHYLINPHDMRLSTLLIDDEADARAVLRAHLQKHCPEVEVAAEAASVKAAIEAIDHHQPDLVFFDVRMTPGTGFDVLEGVAAVNFHTIFVTAHDEYAVRAIRVSALDFLLKPVDPDELVAAVEKVRQVANSRSRKADVRYEVFREEMLRSGNQTGRMVLPTQEGFQVVNIDSIVRCEADRNYTRFWFENGQKALISRTLKSYEELLVPSGFFRIHQSHLVNLSYIVEYKRRKKGGILFLRDGTELPVSETRKMSFQQIFLG